MNEKEFYDLLKKIESNEYKEEKLSLTVSFFGEDPDAFILDDESAILLAGTLKQNNFIKNVNLTGNHIGDKGAIALASVNNLEALNLYSNYIDNEGAIALAKSNFKSLSLKENFIETIKEDNILINAFIENKSIINLDLYNNNLSELFVSQLIINNKSIKTLNLSLNNITDNVLARTKENTTLKELFLDRNNITDKGIEYICENYSIENLCLNGTNITDKGIKLLSKHPTIKKLSIGGCHNITPEGLQYFIGSNFEEINVNGNKISTEMEFYFQQAFEYVKKQKLQSINKQEHFFSQTEIINDSGFAFDSLKKINTNSSANQEDVKEISFHTEHECDLSGNTENHANDVE